MHEIAKGEAALSDYKLIGPEILIRTFVESLKPATHKAYLYSLEAFRKWAGYRDLPEIAKRLCAMTGAEANLALLKYTKSLEGRTPSTVNARTQGIRSLVKLARMLGLISWSLEVQQVKVERYRDTRGPGTTTMRRLYTPSPWNSARPRSAILPADALRKIDRPSAGSNRRSGVLVL